MIRRNRLTVVKIVAFLFGATFALMSSLNDTFDIQIEVEENYIGGQRVVLERRLEEPVHHAEVKISRQESNKQDVQEAIRQEKKSAKPPPRHIPKPFVVDTNKLGPVVNPQPFHYLIEPPKLCDDPKLFLVIYIHSAPQNHQRRALLRSTWGDTSQYADKVVLFFMMGLSTDPTLQSAVKDEAKQYKDIVQESFIDAYHNISYKASGAMRWATQHCNHTKFILKSDDDVFVNTYALLKHMHDLDKAQVNTTGLLLCLTWYKMHVLREGKWNISKEIIPDEYYPPYCSGMGYIMTPDVAQALYLTSYHVPFFWVDDVYITGILSRKLNLTHVNFVKVFMGRKEIDWLMSGEDWYKYVFCHLHDRALFQKAWNRVVAHARQDVIPDLPKVVVGKLADKYGPKKPPELREAEARKAKEEKAKKKKVPTATLR